jgi:dipeptidyl aminopeptidase/acylaminoacyl peptidase
MDGKGDPEASNPIDRLSSKVQCVVVRAVPSDMSVLESRVSSVLLGFRVDPRLGKDSEEYRTAVEASPVSHVPADDPPMLLLHGDADKLVPLARSQALHDKLSAVGVPVKLITIKGGGHRPDFPGAEQKPAEIYANAVRWMDTYLKK